jgi:hypothetical protein
VRTLFLFERRVGVGGAGPALSACPGGSSTIGRLPTPSLRVVLSGAGRRHLAYAETPTPLGEIGKRYGITLTSVARIAQRNAATLRRPGISRAQASDRPVTVAADGTDQAVEPETVPTALEPAAQPTVAPTQVPKPAASTRRTARMARRPSAAAPAEASVANSAPNPTATRRSRTARVAVANSTEPRQFVVTFLAEQTLQADSALDALQQAEALGATEVTSIVRTA